MAEQSFSVGGKLQTPVCSSDQLDMLSCRDGAMQHCQQTPVSNEFSTAVLADSVAVSVCVCGGVFIQYYSHPGSRHGHSLPASSGHVDPFPLFDLASFFYNLIGKQNVLNLSIPIWFL